MLRRVICAAALAALWPPSVAAGAPPTARIVTDSGAVSRGPLSSCSSTFDPATQTSIGLCSDGVLFGAPSLNASRGSVVTFETDAPVEFGQVSVSGAEGSSPVGVPYDTLVDSRSIRFTLPNVSGDVAVPAVAFRWSSGHEAGSGVYVVSLGLPPVPTAEPAAPPSPTSTPAPLPPAPSGPVLAVAGTGLRVDGRGWVRLTLRESGVVRLSARAQGRVVSVRKRLAAGSHRMAFRAPGHGKGAVLVVRFTGDSTGPAAALRRHLVSTPSG